MNRKEKIDRAEEMLRLVSENRPKPPEITSAWKSELSRAVRSERLRGLNDVGVEEERFFWRLAWCAAGLALLLSISFFFYQSEMTTSAYDDDVLSRKLDEAAVIDVTIVYN